MNMTAQVQAKFVPTPSFTPVRTYLLQRKCPCGGTPGPDGECAECHEKRLQRRATHQAGLGTVPPVVHEVLRSPGQPLDQATSAFMESRFSHDFSQVRVHIDANAAKSARAVSAEAYTFGRNIVFAAGRYLPTTDQGRELIAHELAHTLQQGDGGASLPTAIGDDHDASEREAHSLAGLALGSGIRQQSATLHRSNTPGAGDPRPPSRLARQPESPAEQQDKESVLNTLRLYPDVNDKVFRWIYRKAQPFISGLITRRTTWKNPTEWGELDVDIFFKMVSKEAVEEQDIETLLAQAEQSEEWHVKLIAQFRQIHLMSPNLQVVGKLIDWLDGQAIVRRSWQGMVQFDPKTYTSNIVDVPEPPKEPPKPKLPPLLPPRRREHLEGPPPSATG